MVAPIFNLRNVKVTLTNANPVNVYGLTSQFLATGTAPADITVVVLTIQCSNNSGGIANITASVTNSGNAYHLVTDYPVIPNNAFDPLSGNLILGANDVLTIQSSVAGVDVIVSLLEIANATGS